MAYDMKNPENVRKFSELFVKAKNELRIKDMTPDAVLDHVKGLEDALELLIFEKRAEIQGSRDLFEELVKSQDAIKVKELRERDKAAKYRPSLNQITQAEKDANKASKISAKSIAIDKLIASGLDKKKADMVYGFMKLGMDEATARKLAGC